METILIKCGGSVLDELSSEFFTSLQDLVNQGKRLVFVHGGGPDINRMLDLMNVKHEFYNGLRRTDEQTLQVVEMVLTGQTNRKLVEKLTKHQLKAVGISGSDAGTLQGDLINKERLGLVGDIKTVNKELIELVMKENFIPVITPIGVTEDGMKLNINADHAAAAVAKALDVDICLFVTDVDGIILNGDLVTALEESKLSEQIENGNIYGGMIPKVKSAMAVLEKGIKSVFIVSGKKRFISEDQWIGTEIYREERDCK